MQNKAWLSRVATLLDVKAKDLDGNNAIGIFMFDALSFGQTPEEAAESWKKRRTQ